jgi:plasmid stabilization system protein ParE
LRHLTEVAGRAAAEKLLSAFKQKARLLANMPRMGRSVPELGDPELRELIVAPYRMVYEVNDAISVVQIHTIIHARQQFPLEDFLDD